jgi:hypothetical protein
MLIMISLQYWQPNDGRLGVIDFIDQTFGLFGTIIVIGVFSFYILVRLASDPFGRTTWILTGISVSILLIWYYIHKHSMPTWTYIIAIIIFFAMLTFHLLFGFSQTYSTRITNHYLGFAIYGPIFLFLSIISGWVWLEWIGITLILCAVNITTAEIIFARTKTI